jgi:hypothetical protein
MERGVPKDRERKRLWPGPTALCYAAESFDAGQNQ